MMEMLGVEYISYDACSNDLLYIDMHMQKKRGVQNVGVIGTKNKKQA